MDGQIVKVLPDINFYRCDWGGGRFPATDIMFLNETESLFVTSAKDVRLDLKVEEKKIYQKTDSQDKIMAFTQHDISRICKRERHSRAG